MENKITAFSSVKFGNAHTVLIEEKPYNMKASGRMAWVFLTYRMHSNV